MTAVGGALDRSRRHASSPTRCTNFTGRRALSTDALEREVTERGWYREAFSRHHSLGRAQRHRDGLAVLALIVSWNKPIYEAMVSVSHWEP